MRAIQAGQVQRHAVRGDSVQLCFSFPPIWGQVRRLLDAAQLSVSIVFFLWKCAFHHRTEKQTEALMFKKLFFRDPTPSGEHPAPMPIRRNTLKRLFSWKLCFESQLELPASCRRQRRNQVFQAFTLWPHTDKLGSELSSIFQQVYWMMPVKHN